MFSLIGAIIVGFIIGGIAKLLMPGKQPGGFIVTVLLGIAGSALATWLGELLHFYRDGEKAGILFSIVGAVIILFIYKRIMEHKGNTSY